MLKKFMKNLLMATFILLILSSVFFMGIFLLFKPEKKLATLAPQVQGVKVIENPDAIPTENTDQAADLENVIRQLIIEERELNPNLDIKIVIEKSDTSHVRGNVLLHDKKIGIFLATFVNQNWQLVHDGNNTYLCQDIIGYNFPSDYTFDCFDYGTPSLSDCTDLDTEEFNIVEEERLDSKEIATLDLSSNENALNFAPAISKDYKTGINFAGRYNLSEWSCGQDCQDHALVDAKTGKVTMLGLPSAYGIKYNPDSRLIIVNPEENLPAIDSRVENTKTRYYTIDDSIPEKTTLKLVCEK